MQEKDFLWSFLLGYAAGESAKNDFFTQYNSTELLGQELASGEEALRFLQLMQTPDFAALPELRPALGFCVKGGLPSPSEVYGIYKTLLQWEELAILKNEDYPILDALYKEAPLPPLARSFSRSFTEDGAIADSASPELKRIRGLKKSLRARIEKSLQGFLNGEDISERVLSFREGRYVLPFKSSAKNRVQGIIHGYSATGQTAYIEPQETIALNNELLSVDDLEQREIDRLLREWGGLIASHSPELSFLIGRTAYLEVLFAKARFAKDHRAIFPKISPHIRLVQAYNPFLLLKKGRPYTVPVNFSADAQTKGVIVSGPNAGGKSASLKTLALFSEMMRCGLPLPAVGAELPLFSEVLIEMGDHQSLDDELSTFSAHLTALKNILARADKDTLIIIDEIAHATDPVEGEALASAVIDALLDTQAFFVISTHYRGVKSKAFSQAGIKIYATGFDKDFTPLFTLLEDTIGESYALKIAARIGLGQSLLQRAEQNTRDNQSEKERILSRMGAFETRLHNKEQSLSRQEAELLEEQRSFLHEKEIFAAEKAAVRAKGLEAVEQELSQRLRELSELRRTLKQDASRAEAFLVDTRKIIEKEKKKQAEILHKKPKTFIIGQKLHIASLGKTGIIEEVFPNNVSLRVGAFKLTLPKEDLFIENAPLSKEKPAYKSPPPLAQSSIDLRGKLVDEALPLLENSIYKALNAGLGEFSIIHGKGTGALQQAVHRFLKNFPEAREVSFALPQDGGSGKTIVKLQ